MHKIFFLCLIVALIYSCNTKITEPVYTISGTIVNGSNKYLKIIDMTREGFKPDSIKLDQGGVFFIKQKSKEPVDLVFYLQPNQYIRLLPCPGETITLVSQADYFADSCQVKGSFESERLLGLLKQHQKANYILDTLNRFYMAQQLNPELPLIISKIKAISDSVVKENRLVHEQFIKDNPGSLSSYVALSSKLGLYTNVFNIKTDLPIFEMVDTALRNKYDTIVISKMLSSYVDKAKVQAKQVKVPAKGTLPGDTAPEIALPNPYGDTIRLSSLKGKYVLVHFWGSWCKPCRDENILLHQAFKLYRYKGFDIYSVALERNLADWKNTIREDKLLWKNHVSELTYMNSNVARQYNIKSIPANFLVGPDGVIIEANVKPQQLNEKLASLLVPVVTVQNQQQP